MKFGQVITAMATPFDANGEIDFQATTNLVEYLINNGSDGIVVAGTTGYTVGVDWAADTGFEAVARTIVESFRLTTNSAE